jgi:hypothetical protein
MKTLIRITAHAFSGPHIVAPEQDYSFVRPRYAKRPTFAGAARMVAKELNISPRNIVVSRVQAMCYDV